MWSAGRVSHVNAKPNADLFMVCNLVGPWGCPRREGDDSRPGRNRFCNPLVHPEIAARDAALGAMGGPQRLTAFLTLTGQSRPGLVPGR